MSLAVHKYDMGVIGNCSYLAYVDMNARVRWLCLPRFDSSFVFGSLLDEEKGGEFSVSPATGSSSARQYYQRNTNILCTEFATPNGVFRVTDFAPRFYLFERYFRPLMLIRKIEPLSGEPVVAATCNPRGDWGATEPQIVTGSSHIRFLNLETQVRLTTDIPLNYIIERKPFVLSGVRYLVFTYGEPLEAPLASTAEEFLQKTTNYWVQWVKSTSISSRLYQEEVIRSALVLKLHQYEDTGGIIASGTTSLPEHDGAGRNWDYRYCWIRDVYYTLNAFNSIGHFDELEKYFHFIQNVVLNETEAIQPVYGISGDKVLREDELDLAGYRNNRPVRRGNNAYRQRQNDVYGQLLTCLLPLFTDRRLDREWHLRQPRLVGWLLDRIEKSMDIPDAGPWEYRHCQQYHCYTYLFHWAGCKAAVKVAKEIADPALAARAENLGRLSIQKIESCYHPGKRAYAEAIGTSHLDASTLQLIIMQYLDPASDRAREHLAALENELATKQGLFLRYSHHDGLGLPGTSFLVCSFWHAEALACAGRVDEASEVLERAMQCRNHVGLLSEDADASFGQWGNFPQTYSHVGLMNAVCRIVNKREMPIFI